MVKSKRGQAALEFLTTYAWAFLVFLIMVMALAYFGVLDPKKLVPEKFNPDIHVCEEFVAYVEGLSGTYDELVEWDEVSCDSFRDKTESELAIENCNNNPDDDNCFCEESKWIYYDLKCRDKNGDLWSKDNPSTENATLFYPRSELFTGCSQVGKNTCTKARPKTPCEKGNPDFVEETINVAQCPEGYGTTRFFNATPEGKMIAGSMTIFCRKLFVRNTNYTRLEPEYKTICREKNPVEKLMEKDCDWLFDTISKERIDCFKLLGRWQRRLFCDVEKYQDLKTAWRNKECEI